MNHSIEADVDRDVREAAGALYAQRRRVQAAFGTHADLVVTPAWDMLLLLLKHRGRQDIQVAEVCAASQVPRATALRIMAALEDRGIIRRKPDPRDYRARLVELTEAGCDLVSQSIVAAA